MQQILHWTRRLIYPAAAILLILAGIMVLKSPYTSKSDGKILAVYDAESSVEDCDKARDMTPDKENVSSEGLAVLLASSFCCCGDGGWILARERRVKDGPPASDAAQPLDVD
jgi:hypothetical protein